MSTDTTRVTLREITLGNWRACIDLKVAPGQEDFVASNVYSLAQAKVNERLTPLAVYDGRICGVDPGPDDPMVGFVMYQVMDGVGFIMRLMVDQRFQGRGYGRATCVEVIRRLKATPEIETIATSYAHGNNAARDLYHGLGFRSWGKTTEREEYVKLDWHPHDG